MKLFYRKTGAGLPFIILHGLYGSSDNWVTIGRELSSRFQVVLPDLRNHGRSPHSEIHSYDSMANDLHELMDDLNIPKAIVLGHSMGGKVAINFALKYGRRIEHLIVLDIAPKSYLTSLNFQIETLNHKHIIETMLSFNFSGISRREQLDEALSKSIKSLQIRQFLLKNVKRNDDKTFGWILNVNALYSNLKEILDGVSFKPEISGDVISNFPVLFLKGANSNYIIKDDEDMIKRMFPYSVIETIPMAGHWIHVDQPIKMLESVYRFLNFF